MSRKTQIGWMTVGMLLSLFSIALAMKLRDGNKAVAQSDDKPAEARTVEAPPSLMPVLDSKPMPKPPEVKLLPPELPSPPIIRTSATEVTAPVPKPSQTGQPLPPISFDPVPVPAKNPDFSPPPNWSDPRPLKALDLPNTSFEPKKNPPPLVTGKPAEDPFASSNHATISSPVAETVKKEIVPVSATSKTEPGEPPMMVAKGPVVSYQVRGKTETLPDIARRTLGTSERWTEIAKLNPELKPDTVLAFGTTVKLPADACLQDDTDTVKPLPALHARTTAKAKVLPLTGTYPCNMDDQKNLTLPKAIREQFGNSDTLLVSPGADHCLWITNHAHLERMSERIEHSPAREVDVRVFKRLYYAQTEKATVTAEGRINISDKLAQFAGLGQEMVLVGIDEHFELWDAARWKQYTQQKSAAARASVDD